MAKLNNGNGYWRNCRRFPFQKNSQTPLLFSNIYNKIIPKRKGEQMNKTKKIKKIITTLIFLILFIILGNTKSNAGSLYLDNLNFDAKINQDGSMNVTETWDISISETNTLFKTFKTDNSNRLKLLFCIE